MKIDSAQISEKETTFEGEQPKEILDAGDLSARLEEPISHIPYMPHVASRELLVQGILGVHLSLQCSRCIKMFSTSVHDLSFLRVYELMSDSQIVDITPDIREEVILNIPLFPICKSDCKGLCPQCCRNLNERECGCRSEKTDDRWGNIKQFRNLEGEKKWLYLKEKHQRANQNHVQDHIKNQSLQRDLVHSVEVNKYPIAYVLRVGPIKAAKYSRSNLLSNIFSP